MKTVFLIKFCLRKMFKLCGSCWKCNFDAVSLCIGKISNGHTGFFVVFDKKRRFIFDGRFFYRRFFGWRTIGACGVWMASFAIERVVQLSWSCKARYMYGTPELKEPKYLKVGFSRSRIWRNKGTREALQHDESTLDNLNFTR